MTGLELKIIRLQRGFKQLQLSREARINPTRLSKIENGWAEASEDEIKAIKKALGLVGATVEASASSD